MTMASAFSRDEPPPAFQVDEILEQILKDDQEEWEYEYSTTETETFYLTVDLSHPDFKERRGKVANYSRGGYYKAKPVADPEKDDGDEATARAGKPRQTHHEDGDDNDEDEDMHEDDETNHPGRRRRLDKGKGVDRGSPATNDDEPDAESQESLGDIQILDLHSPHPIFSYRGRIFEGDWAEMIGTEIILTKRGEGDTNYPPLPALRNLEDGIDLLAASASKILTREKVLKPLIGTEEAERKQALEEVKKEWNIRIPMGKRDKEGEKGEQARFLESLMALKKKKGETDNVTVYARPAGEERLPTTRRPRENAATERRPAKRRSRRTGPSWNRDGMGSLGVGGSSGATGHGSQPEGSSLSTPTPLRWNDLMTPRSEAASRQTREMGEDEVEDEDVKMSG